MKYTKLEIVIWRSLGVVLVSASLWRIYEILTTSFNFSVPQDLGTFIAMIVTVLIFLPPGILILVKFRFFSIFTRKDVKS